MTFRADRLRQLIKKTGITTPKIADAVGVSERMIRNYKAGKHIPDTEHVARLADILATNIDYLLDRSNYPGVMTDAHLRLAAAFDRGDTDEVLAIIRQKALQEGRDKDRLPGEHPGPEKDPLA